MSRQGTERTRVRLAPPNSGVGAFGRPLGRGGCDRRPWSAMGQPAQWRERGPRDEDHGRDSDQSGAGESGRRGVVMAVVPVLRWGLPCWIVAWATSGVGQLSGQAERPEIGRVEFAGNAAFSDAVLSRAVFAEESGCPFVLAITTCALGLEWGRQSNPYSPRVLEDDAERLRILYRAHGFRGVVVSAVAVPEDDGAIAVVFNIEEGAPFRVGAINVVGDSLPPGLALLESFPVQVGDPLSFLLIEEAADTLATRLRNVGYASAEVFLGFFLGEGSDWATVSFRVDLGPKTRFGPIWITGNRLLADEVILGRLPFREGQLFEERLIGEAQRSLHELDIVVRSRVERDTLAAGQAVMPIRVRVVEGDVHRLRPGGGFNSLDCLNAEVRWLSRNFRGGGRTLQIRGRISNLLATTLERTPLCAQAGSGSFGQVNWIVGVDLNQPTFLTRRVNLAAGLFAQRQSRRNLFVRDAMGVDLGVNRALGARSFLNVRYQPQINRLAAAEVTLCATFLACAPDDIELLSGTQWLAPVAVSFNRDGSDDLLQPTHGTRALVALELGHRFTGSSYRYLRAFVDGSAYRSVDERTTLALRIRGGRIGLGGFGGRDAGEGYHAVVPPQKRFYGGGANSVRGFAQGNLGPRSLTIAVEELLRRPTVRGDPPCQPASVRNLACDGNALLNPDLYQLRPVGGLAMLEASAELRFDLADGLVGGAAFVDMGQVWPERWTGAKLEVSPGVGVRYNTRFGPIRLDVAYPFRGPEPLQVVTSQIRPFDPGLDRPGDRIDIAPQGAPEERIDWVVSEDLALLGPKVLYGEDASFSFRRLQIHFSIGQAF